MRINDPLASFARFEREKNRVNLVCPPTQTFFGRPSNPHHMQIWRFWKKAQKNLEIRTSNLETSKICVKWKQQRQIICFRVFFNLLVFFVLPWVVDSWPWVGIPNRDSHGQTVRVGRSALGSCGQYCDTFLEMEFRIRNYYPMDRIGCSFVASCKWGITAAKILLFAVSSCSASSSEDCTKLVGESHPDS